MAKGQIAKGRVADKIKEAFGDAYLGEMGGKLYIEMDDGGEKVQVAINMTCPKVLFEAGASAGAGAPTPPPTSAFGVGSAAYMAAQTPPAAEINEKERENINKLIEQLGL